MTSAEETKIVNALLGTNYITMTDKAWNEVANFKHGISPTIIELFHDKLNIYGYVVNNKNLPTDVICVIINAYSRYDKNIITELIKSNPQTFTMDLARKHSSIISACDAWTTFWRYNECYNTTFLHDYFEYLSGNNFAWLLANRPELITMPLVNRHKGIIIHFNTLALIETIITEKR